MPDDRFHSRAEVDREVRARFKFANPENFREIVEGIIDTFVEYEEALHRLRGRIYELEHSVEEVHDRIDNHLVRMPDGC